MCLNTGSQLVVLSGMLPLGKDFGRFRAWCSSCFLSVSREEMKCRQPASHCCLHAFCDCCLVFLPCWTLLFCNQKPRTPCLGCCLSRHSVTATAKCLTQLQCLSAGGVVKSVTSSPWWKVPHSHEVNLSATTTLSIQQLGWWFSGSSACSANVSSEPKDPC